MRHLKKFLISLMIGISIGLAACQTTGAGNAPVSPAKPPVNVSARDFGFKITTWSPQCDYGATLPDDKMTIVCRLSNGNNLAGTALLRQMPTDVEAAMEASFASFATRYAEGNSYSTSSKKVTKTVIGESEATVWHRKLSINGNTRHVSVIFWPNSAGGVEKLAAIFIFARGHSSPIEGETFDQFITGVSA